MKSTPAVGWVRANELPDRDATVELLQLRRRLEDLQKELAKARTSAPKGSEGLAQGNETHALRFTFETYSPDGIEHLSWSSTFNATWNQIFSVVAPLMINEATEYPIKAALDAMLEEHNLSKLQAEKQLARKRISGIDLPG